MAIFRKVHTSFWSDPFVQDLTIEQRYFYLYLLTNEQTKQCGVYEISKKQISFDTGLSQDKVKTLLQYFIKCGKIRYNEITRELAVGKWLKYNNSNSPRIKKCIDTEFERVKDRLLIQYVYSMDTLQEEEQEEEQEEVKENKKIINKFDLYCTRYVETYNEIFSTQHKVTTQIQSSLKKVLVNYNIDQICQAIKNSQTSNAWVADKVSSNPIIVLRQKNNGGECDYIGDLLNSKKKVNQSDIIGRVSNL